jgi:Rieske Fe-S protein
MSNWRADFPVVRDEDNYVTRREFTKFLGLTSFAFLAGTFAAVLRKWVKNVWPAAHPAVPVAKTDEIPVGGYKLFRHPTQDDPCILLRLEDAKFVAYNQRCTHLSCPVYFNASERQLVCPCHNGFFSAEDGRVLAGPPKRPLEQLSVAVDSASVWVERV